jgi:hypothetical protein
VRVGALWVGLLVVDDGVEARGPEGVDHVAAMVGAPRLDADIELDLAELHPPAVAGVEHLDDVGVDPGEDLGDPG